MTSIRSSIRSNSCTLVSAIVVAVFLALLIAGCGEDVDDASSSTTATSAKVTTSSTTTAAASSDPTAVGETTTTIGTSDPSAMDMFIGSEQRALTIQSCTAAVGSLELTATDAAGNTVTVTVQDGTGGVTYRGPSEDREGSVRTSDIRTDGSFTASGIMSVADDTAPAPAQLQFAGRCPT